MRRDVGFTLIEMSIVLVVIGLIVGGVLAGKELIHSAILRKQVTQIEQYNTAVTTFFGKYNTFPGDLSPADAVAFGFANRSGARGHGDENGVLEPCNTAPLNFSALPIGCETLLFWGDLSKAQLISDNLSANTDTDMNTTSIAQSLNYTPTAKIEKMPVYVTTSPSNQNVYVVSNWFPANSGSAIDPFDAFILDTKMDDGIPLSGSVIAVTSGSMGTVPAVLTVPDTRSYSNCQSSNTYAILSSGGKWCNLSFKMSGF